MSKLGELFSDDYNFETLVTPSLIVALPVLITATMLGFNVNAATGATILGFQVLLFPLWLIANIFRDAGRWLSTKVFPDVLPTHDHLRLRTGANGYTVKTDRARIENVTGVTLLNARQETANPNKADEIINDAVAIAREKMRDRDKFKLLRRELKSLGFWRNLVAVKLFAMIVVTICFAISLTAFFVYDQQLIYLTSALINLLILLVWVILIRRSRVIAAAERYKVQFFRSITTI